MEPFFSVIMAVYNGAEFLHYSIQSVINQTYENFEFIIVDDGSTDNSLESIKEFKDERIRVFSKINGGSASGYNLGISKSTGEYIYIIDHDDFIETNFLECIYRILNNNYNDLVITNMEGVKEFNPNHLDTSIFKAVERTFDDNFTFLKFYFNNVSSLGLNYSNKVFRSSIMKSVKFNESNIVMDLPTIYRHLLLVRSSCITYETTFFHVKTPNSLSRGKPNLKYLLDIKTSMTGLIDEFRELDGYEDVYRLALRWFYPSLLMISIRLLRFRTLDNSHFKYLIDYFKSILSIVILR